MNENITPSRPAAPGRHRLRRLWTALILIGGCLAFALPFGRAHAAAADADTLTALGAAFEQNRGQFGPDALFGVRSAGFAMRFDAGGADLLTRRADGSAWRLRLIPADAAGSAPQAESPRSGRVNYYRGADAGAWHTGVATYDRVRYPDVYPDVDLVYRAYGDRVEYDFVVAPGADPSVVGLVVDGAERLSIDTDGSLIAHSGHDAFRMAAPYIYQRAGAATVEIDGRFAIEDGQRIRFIVGDYDRDRELVIDPVLLGWSTRHGGSAMDEPREIAVDDAGFIYVTGGTQSPDFLGAGAAATGKDVFVSKIAPNGQALIYTTLLGGDMTEDAVGLAVDARGHAYVAGQSESANFPTVNAFDATLGGDADYFVARLDARGIVEYSTYYGGAGRDGEFDGGLALGSGDIAWLTGRTASLPPNGLPLQNPYESTCALATCAFAAGFDTHTGGAASLVYGTYIGGDGDEGGKSIAVDANDHLYVFGFTGSDTQLIDPAQGFQPLSADVNNNDTFLVKLDPTLSGAAQLLYSTYLCGPDDESEDGQVIAGDNGIAWVLGATSSVSGPLSTDFPNKNAMQAQNAGGQDAYVMKIDTTLSGADSLLFATFVGASSTESAWGLAVDSNENLYLAMATASFDFPLVAPLAQFMPFTPPDAVLVHLDASGTTIHTSTPLPGANRLAVDAADNVFVAGTTQTPDFALVSPLPPSPAGLADIFLGRVAGRDLSGVTLEVADTGGPAATNAAFAFRYTLTNNGDAPIDSVTLASDLPAGVTYEALPAVCNFNGPDLACSTDGISITPVAPGENLTWFVRGQSATAGDYGVTAASVTTLPVDPDASDNSDSHSITLDASASIPAGTLRLADFDATGLSYDIGGFMMDTPRGVLASPNGSLDEFASFMVFDGAIPLHIREIWSQGRVAFGLVERGNWTPAPFDGGSLFAPEALADRVYAEVDAMGRLELRSAPPFGPGILLDEAFVGLDPAKAFEITLAGNTASVFYDGQLVAQGNPFQSGGAASGQVGDDFVVSIGGGTDQLGAALIDRQPPLATSAGGTSIPSNPQTCSQTTFNPSPRRDPGTFGWSTFNTGEVPIDWSVSNDIELCGGGVVPGGNLTGGSGDAACIDTDVIGPGYVQSYMCSPLIDLSTSADPDLQFRLAWQIASDSGEDAFDVLIGTEPPSAATIGGYEPVYSAPGNVGVFGATGEVQTVQLTPGEAVHICLRYAGDHDWYAQVDDITVSAELCNGPAFGDSDGDGVDDGTDNCTDVPNASQLDTDGDGIGNRCDADFDGDCIVSVPDLGVMRQNFFATGDLPTDLNGDGVTNPIDLGLLRGLFFAEPGASAVATTCAATMCEGTYNAFTDGTIYKIGDRSVIGFWGRETCPGTTSLADGSDWNLIPTTCRCN